MHRVVPDFGFRKHFCMINISFGPSSVSLSAHLSFQDTFATAIDPDILQKQYSLTVFPIVVSQRMRFPHGNLHDPFVPQYSREVVRVRILVVVVEFLMFGVISDVKRDGRISAGPLYITVFLDDLLPNQSSVQFASGSGMTYVDNQVGKNMILDIFESFELHNFGLPHRLDGTHWHFRDIDRTSFVPTKIFDHLLGVFNFTDIDRSSKLERRL